MNIKTIYSKAPTRIDLAGGTVDIWPLYLFLRNPITINLGIDLFAKAQIDLAPSQQKGAVYLKSVDQKTEVKLSWKDILEDWTPPPQLALHYKLLRFFSLRRKQKDSFAYDLKLTTEALSPAGAGLGGSSTLSIAMIGALATWAQDGKALLPETDGESFIEIVRDIETTVIQVPAGLQDYYGAMYGGLQTLHWGAGTHSREPIDSTLIEELESRLMLFYSGQSRNSGINNWSLFKGFIDKDASVKEKFEKINSATQHLYQALQKRDWSSVGQAIYQEWTTRKTLAQGITTAEIDQAFAAAEKLTSVAGKVCGAGGGGCFFIYLPIENASERKTIRGQIEKTFEQFGIKSLPFHGVAHGLSIQVERG